MWKICPLYGGEIMVSSFGRVLLPPRTATMPYGGVRKYVPLPTFGHKTRASKRARHVYMGMYAWKIGNIKIHRAVCSAFHGLPPLGKPVVIHIDSDGTNNREENLKWGTQKENLNHPIFIAYCKRRVGENSPTTKAKRKSELASQGPRPHTQQGPSHVCA